MGSKRGISERNDQVFRPKYRPISGVSQASVSLLQREMNFRIRKTELDARNWTWEQAAKLCDEIPGFNSAELAAMLRSQKI